MSEDNNTRLRELVAEVAAAYFANSHVAVSDIPTVVEKIAASLSAVGGSETAAAEPEAPVAEAELAKTSPAQVRKSITPDALISFEDGRGYKTLKRHLSVKGLTPEQYREKWGLPRDYPMVSPNYSAARSNLAKALGLGQLGRQSRQAAPAAPAPTVRKRRAKAAG